MTAGSTNTYSAEYLNGAGTIDKAGMFAYQTCGNWAYDQMHAGGAGTYSFSWTPASVGTYTLCCRAWNDGIAECRGACVDGPPRYSCAGGASCMTVNVTQPPPSIPTGQCAAGSDAEPASLTWNTTWTWTNGDHIKITRADSGAVLYDGAGTSPFTFSAPREVPLIARTYYTSPNYSDPSNQLTCQAAAYQPITVSGPLKEFTIGSCSTVPLGTSTVAVSSASGQKPCGSDNALTYSCRRPTADSYSCTVTSNNRTCIANGIDPVAASTLSFSASGIPAGYTFAGLAASGCSPSHSNVAVTFTTSPQTVSESAVFPFSGMGSNWIKLKDTSFYQTSINSLGIPMSSQSIPFSANPFVPGDPDDDASQFFIMGNAGTSANFTISPNSAYSRSNWHTDTYSVQPHMPLSQFIEYMRSRKEFTPLSSVSSNLAELTKSGIYYYHSGNTDLAIDNPSIPAGVRAVLVVDGTGKVSINGSANFNIGGSDSPTNSLAIMADTISFAPTVQKAGGIFIANTINSGPTVDSGLKVVGNLIALNTLNNDRQRADTSRPAVLIVFKPQLYLDLLPYLSISKYDWQQMQ